MNWTNVKRLSAIIAVFVLVLFPALFAIIWFYWVVFSFGLYALLFFFVPITGIWLILRALDEGERKVLWRSALCGIALAGGVLLTADDRTSAGMVALWCGLAGGWCGLAVSHCLRPPEKAHRGGLLGLAAGALVVIPASYILPCGLLHLTATAGVPTRQTYGLSVIVWVMVCAATAFVGSQIGLMGSDVYEQLDANK